LCKNRAFYQKIYLDIRLPAAHLKAEPPGNNTDLLG